MKPTPTPEQIAAVFGCSPAQARRQLETNACQLARMAAQAENTGRKVNGYAAGQLRRMAAKLRPC